MVMVEILQSPPPHPPPFPQSMEKDAPERAVCVYERMITDLPTSLEAWLAYLSYIVGGKGCVITLTCSAPLICRAAE